MGRHDPAEPDLLARSALGRPVNVPVSDDGDDRIAPGDRMVGEKDDREPIGRHLDPAEHDALTRQLDLDPRARAREGRELPVAKMMLASPR